MKMTPEELHGRLIEAGAVLLSMKGGDDHFFRVRSNMPPVVQDAVAAYGYTAEAMPVPHPTSAQIDRMEEALAWVRLIPVDKPSADPASRNGGATMRRLVHTRLLVRPMSWYTTPANPKHIHSWRAVADMFGAELSAVKKWHAQAICTIIDALSIRKSIY